MTLLHLVDSWAGVVRLALLETDGVDHNLTLNVPPNYDAFVVPENGFPSYCR